MTKHNVMVLLASSLFFVSIQCRLLPIMSEDNEDGEIWAVLVAGSTGWMNYRHQADVCHSYHVLVDHGVKKENIITMMYDDVANDEENPYKGKIFNHPKGKDVYEGVVIDYKGDDVTPKNFMAVLEGRAADTNGKKVLNATKKDRVFIYFSDHGGSGFLVFPSGFLSAKDLLQTFTNMHEAGRYRQLTFYLEACHSGSMFYSVLPANLSVYTLTASSSNENSYACYCDSDHLNFNCLGDEFSVSWMEDADKENLNDETLYKQYKIVKMNTNGSHVSRYGDSSIPLESVADFMGETERSVDRTQLLTGTSHYESWPAIEVPLKTLEAKLKRETDKEKQASLQKEIKEMKEKRAALESHIHGLAKKLHPVHYGKLLQRGSGAITQLDCHHDVIQTFHRICYPLHENPYVIEYSHILTNLCEHGTPTQDILDAMKEHCMKRPVDTVL